MNCAIQKQVLFNLIRYIYVLLRLKCMTNLFMQGLFVITIKILSFSYSEVWTAVVNWHIQILLVWLPDQCIYRFYNKSNYKDFSNIVGHHECNVRNHSVYNFFWLKFYFMTCQWLRLCRSNDMVISDWWIGDVKEGRGDLRYDMAFTWRDWVNPWKSSVRVTSGAAWIWTVHHTSMCKRWACLSQLMWSKIS
jgi:hypothetical protein